MMATPSPYRAFSVGGLAASWSLDLPAGAVVVVLAGAVFLIAAAASALRAGRLGRRGANRGSAGRATGAQAAPKKADI